jgi:hypothetical protein
VHPTGLENLYNSTYAFNSPYSFGNAPGFWTEFDYLAARNFSIGVRLDYLNSWTGRHTEQGVVFDDSLTALNIYAAASYRWQVSNLLQIRPEVGVGVPLLYDFYSHHFVPGSYYPADALYSATPFTAFASLAGEFTVSPRWSVNAEVGYRYLRANDMSLDWSNSNPYVNAPSDLGQVVDMSSFYFSVGVGTTFN